MTRYWRNGFVRAAPPVLLIATILGVWQLVGGGSRATMPAPSQIVRAFVDTRGVLPAHIATTLTETGLGVVLGVSIGVVLAVLVTSSVVVRRALRPLLVISQTIPFPVLFLLLVLAFGYGLTPKVIVVALVVFFPVTVTTASGLEQADAELVDLVRSFGASRMQRLRHVLIPAALPPALAGLRISLTYAIAAAVIGESIGARSGLGLYIARSQRSFRYDQIWVGMFVVAALSITLYSCVFVVERLACPWEHAESSAGTAA